MLSTVSKIDPFNSYFCSSSNKIARFYCQIYSTIAIKVFVHSGCKINLERWENFKAADVRMTRNNSEILLSVPKAYF